mgnify:CR=1 FL=1
MWKAKIILTDVLNVEFPTEAELEFVTSVINGGKTDHTEKANNICAYMEKEGNESIVYDKLCALANER